MHLQHLELVALVGLNIMITYMPVTPGGSVCMDLESNTEDEAWDKLLIAASHMPYKTKKNFIARGYTVEKCEEDNHK